MFVCPYCQTRLEKKIEYIPLSFKRSAILKFIVESGPGGVWSVDLKKKFFARSETDTVIRTTIHHINQKIAPMKIITRGGVIRLEPH